jgi:hypothetical protein
MILIPLIANAIVICGICAELVAISLGMANADQLLVISAISGLITLVSFELSKDAMSLLQATPDAARHSKEQATDEV